MRSTFLFLLCTAALTAHECWLQPLTFQPEAGQKVPLALLVGMDFQGDPRVFNRDRIAAFRRFSATGIEELTPREEPSPHFDLPPLAAGTHVVAYDSTGSLITLAADKFHAYLHEDGMEYVIALREKAGQSAAPGRERYRRCAKTIVQCGPAADGAHALRTDQTLEIVPLANPATVRPGASMKFQLLFQQTPLADTLVQAWHRANGHTTKLQGRTNAAGEVEFILPAGGEWMISTVRMIATTDHADADWESYWGNLTFSIQP